MYDKAGTKWGRVPYIGVHTARDAHVLGIAYAYGEEPLIGQ